MKAKVMTFAFAFTVAIAGVLSPATAAAQSGSNSITFISNKDKDESNPFYDMAKSFFSHDPHYKTELVVDHLHDLESIVTYLNENKPPKGDEWSIVNIVTHSSQFGLSMRLTPKMKLGIKTKTWQEFDEKYRSNFPRKVSTLSRDSLVTLWGCSFGKKKEHLSALAGLFYGRNGPAKLRSPSQRLFFSRDIEKNSIRHFFVEEYTVFSKDKKEEAVLAGEFRARYGFSVEDWAVAMASTSLVHEEDAFLESSEFKISFHVDRESLNRFRTVKAFMKFQPEIKTYLKDLDISLSELAVHVVKGGGRAHMRLTATTNIYTVLQKTKKTEEEVMVYARA